MKFAIATICLLVTSFTATAFADGYSFDCSNAEGSIRISSRGDQTQVDGTSYTSVVKLDDLELWSPLKTSQTQVEVFSAGSRNILNQFYDSCGAITKLTFTQEVKIYYTGTDNKVAEALLLCKNSAEKTSIRRGCSADE